MARKKANEEAKITATNETNLTELQKEIINDEFYDETKTQITLDGLSSLSKDVKKSAAFVNDKQIRLIVDNYYATQAHRMNVANQIRAVKQGFDEVQDGEQPAIAWLLEDIKNRENQIKKMIAEYTKTVPVCQWMMAIKGIGPVFAANLWSYIDMSKCKHANQWLAYAGLNDNNAPWLGKEKAAELVNEAYKKFKLSNKDDVTMDVIWHVAIKSGRNARTVKEGFYKHLESSKKKETQKTALIAYMAKPPYNTDLKKVCYLIGESFVKVSNKGSLYGELYKERKAFENYMNEKGEYKDQAEKLLREKNYNKDTDTYEYLSKGILSPGHINMRAKRWAVKIFMTHVFEAAYYYTYNEKPPVIWPIAFGGHTDYIEPEVPYDQYIKITN